MAQQRTVVVLGTATPGGFPVYGTAYSSVLNETDPTLSIEPMNTKGSTENVAPRDWQLKQRVETKEAA